MNRNNNNNVDRCEKVAMRCVTENLEGKKFGDKINSRFLAANFYDDT